MARQSDDRVWRKIHSLVRKAHGANVRAGIPDGELAEIGLIHEFGAPGANIPERSFIRQTFRNRRSEIIALQAKISAAIMAGKIDARRAMALLGAWLAGAIKATITSDGQFVPLASATVKAKGSSKALIDTAQMLNAITFEVET